MLPIRPTTLWEISRPGNIECNMKGWKTLIIGVTNLGPITLQSVKLLAAASIKSDQQGSACLDPIVTNNK